MLKPNQDMRRFGNRIKINEYGMRSDDFSKEKEDISEYRIIVFGDSVINGGNQTDQSQLATELIRSSIILNFPDRKITVGNASAGSWGPPNILSYIEEFGFFDADTVIIVLSNHDYADTPTFEALNEKTHPTVGPAFAISEAATRYLPRLFRAFAGRQPSEIQVSADSKDIDLCLYALREIFALSKRSGAKTAVILHWTQTELKTGKLPTGIEKIASIGRQAGVPVYHDREELEKSIMFGKNPYRDNIHLNPVGQRILGRIFEKIILDFITNQ